MAGDWIKLETVTPDKPEVLRIAETLGIAPEHALGCLIRVWIWADQQSLDGNALTVTEAALDRIARHAGITQALCDVGWARKISTGYSLTNFNRHNGKTAKNRVLNAQRASRYRNAQSVINALPREEKRRIERTTPSQAISTGAQDAAAGVVCEKTPDPALVAHVDRLRVTAAVGTDAHARAGELHAICSANQVKATASHPLLVDWAREGVTPAQLTRAITEARKSNAGPLNPAYLEPILERVRNGTIDAKPAPAPLAASHSTEKAQQALQEVRQARETAAPMPDHVRDLIARLKPEF